MPGTNSQAVAEMTLLLMLSALRQVSYFDTKTREGLGWSFPPNIQDSLGEISGKTVGFVGYGEIPQRLAPISMMMSAPAVLSRCDLCLKVIRQLSLVSWQHIC